MKQRTASSDDTVIIGSLVVALVVIGLIVMVIV